MFVRSVVCTCSIILASLGMAAITILVNRCRLPCQIYGLLNYASIFLSIIGK